MPGYCSYCNFRLDMCKCPPAPKSLPQQQKLLTMRSSDSTKKPTTMMFSSTKPLSKVIGRTARLMLTKTAVEWLRRFAYVIEKVEVSQITLHKASFVRLVQKNGGSVSVMRFPGIRVSAVWINHTEVRCVEEYRDRWTLLKNWTLNGSQIS